MARVGHHPIAQEDPNRCRNRGVHWNDQAGGLVDRTAGLVDRTAGLVDRTAGRRTMKMVSMTDYDHFSSVP